MMQKEIFTQISWEKIVFKNLVLVMNEKESNFIGGICFVSAKCQKTWKQSVSIFYTSHFVYKRRKLRNIYVGYLTL